MSERKKPSITTALETEGLKHLKNFGEQIDIPIPFYGRVSEAIKKPETTKSLMYDNLVLGIAGAPILKAAQRSTEQARQALWERGETVDPVQLNKETVKKITPIPIGNPFNPLDIAATYGSRVGTTALGNALNAFGDTFLTDDPVSKPWEIRQSDINHTFGQMAYDAALFTKGFNAVKALQKPTVGLVDELVNGAARSFVGGTVTGAARAAGEKDYTRIPTQAVSEGAFAAGADVGLDLLGQGIKRGAQTIKRTYDARPRTVTVEQGPRVPAGPEQAPQIIDVEAMPLDDDIVPSKPAPVNEPTVIDVAPIDEPLVANQSENLLDGLLIEVGDGRWSPYQLKYPPNGRDIQYGERIYRKKGFVGPGSKHFDPREHVLVEYSEILRNAETKGTPEVKDALGRLSYHYDKWYAAYEQGLAESPGGFVSFVLDNLDNEPVLAPLFDVKIPTSDYLAHVRTQVIDKGPSGPGIRINELQSDALQKPKNKLREFEGAVAESKTWVRKVLAELIWTAKRNKQGFIDLPTSKTAASLFDKDPTKLPFSQYDKSFLNELRRFGKVIKVQDDKHVFWRLLLNTTAGLSAIIAIALGEEEAEAATIPDAELVGQIVKRFADKVVKRAVKKIVNGVEQTVEVNVLEPSNVAIKTSLKNFTDPRRALEALRKNLTKEQLARLTIDGKDVDKVLESLPKETVPGAYLPALEQLEPAHPIQQYDEALTRARELKSKTSLTREEEVELLALDMKRSFMRQDVQGRIEGRPISNQGEDLAVKKPNYDQQETGGILNYKISVPEQRTNLVYDKKNKEVPNPGSKIQPHLRQAMIEELGPTRIVSEFKKNVVELNDQELFKVYKEYTEAQAVSGAKAGTDRERADSVPVAEKAKSKALKDKEASLRKMGDMLTFDDLAELSGLSKAQIIGVDTALETGVRGISNGRVKAIIAEHQQELIRRQNERLLNYKKTVTEAKVRATEELQQNQPVQAARAVAYKAKQKEAQAANAMLVNALIKESGYDIRDVAKALIYEDVDFADKMAARVTAKFVQQMDIVGLAKALNGGMTENAGWLGRRIKYVNARYASLVKLKNNEALQDTRLWLDLFKTHDVLSKNKFKTVAKWERWNKQRTLTMEQISPDDAEVGAVLKFKGRRSALIEAYDEANASQEQLLAKLDDMSQSDEVIDKPTITIDMDEMVKVPVEGSKVATINPITQYEIVYDDGAGNRIRQQMTGEQVIAMSKDPSFKVLEVSAFDEAHGQEIARFEKASRDTLNALNAGINPEQIKSQLNLLVAHARKHLARFGYNAEEYLSTTNQGLDAKGIRILRDLVNAQHFTTFLIRKYPQLNKVLSAVLDRQEIVEEAVAAVDSLFDEGRLIKSFKAKYPHVAEVYEKMLSAWDVRRNVPLEEITAGKAEIMSMLTPEGQALFTRLDNAFTNARIKNQQMGRAAIDQLGDSHFRKIKGPVTQQDAGFLAELPEEEKSLIQRYLDVMKERLFSNPNYIGQRHLGRFVVTYFNENAVAVGRESFDDEVAALAAFRTFENRPNDYTSAQVIDKQKMVKFERGKGDKTVQEKTIPIDSKLVDSLDDPFDYPIALLDKIMPSKAEYDEVAQQGIGSLVDRGVRSLDQSLQRRGYVPREAVSLEDAYTNIIDQARSFADIFGRARLRNDENKLIAAVQAATTPGKRDAVVKEARSLIKVGTQELDRDEASAVFNLIRTAVAWRQFAFSFRYFLQNMAQEPMMIGTVASRYGQKGTAIFIGTYKYLKAQLRAFSVLDDKTYKTKLARVVGQSIKDQEVFRAVSRIINLNVVSEGSYINEILDAGQVSGKKVARVMTAFAQSAEAHNQFISAMTFARIGKELFGYTGDTLDKFIRQNMITATPRKGQVFWPRILRTNNQTANQTAQLALIFQRFSNELNGMNFHAMRDLIRSVYDRDLIAPNLPGKISARASEGRSRAQAPWLAVNLALNLGVNAATDPKYAMLLGIFGSTGFISTAIIAKALGVWPDGTTPEDFQKTLARYPNSWIVAKGPLRDWDSEIRAAQEEFLDFKANKFQSASERKAYEFLNGSGVWAFADMNMQNALGVQDMLTNTNLFDYFQRSGSKIASTYGTAKETGDWKPFVGELSGSFVKAGLQLADLNENGRSYYMVKGEKRYVKDSFGISSAVGGFFGGQQHNVTRAERATKDEAVLAKLFSDHRNSVKGQYLTARKKGVSPMTAAMQARRQMLAWHSLMNRKYKGVKALTGPYDYYEDGTVATPKKKLDEWITDIEKEFADKKQSRNVPTLERNQTAREKSRNAFVER